MSLQLSANSLVQEKVYLHTDRPVYVTGDVMHYKFYCIDNNTKHLSLNSRVGYVLLRNNSDYASVKIRLSIDNGVSTGNYVIPDSLRSGTYELVAFTNVMNNSNAANFFRKEIVVVNRSDQFLDFKLPLNSKADTDTSSSVIIKTDQEVYGARKKVTVTIDHVKAESNVSVSVYEKPDFQYNDVSIKDILMQNTTWTLNKANTSYSLENKAKILRGSVVNADTHQKLKNKIVLLSCLDSIPNLQYAVTDSLGTFKMLLNDYYNDRELFLTVLNHSDDQHETILVDDKFKVSNDWNPAIIPLKTKDREYFVKSQGISYVNSIYFKKPGNSTASIEFSKSTCPQFYNRPVTRIHLADFEPLSNFKEIATEVLPQVRIIKKNNQYQLQVLNTQLNQYHFLKPAVFLDGVFLDDIDKIMKLGSEEIKTIDVITDERTFGDLIFGGCVSITTKTKEMYRSKPADASLRFVNDVPNMNVSEKTDDFAAINNDKLPYFKQLLYWNPDMQIKPSIHNNFSFYTSDNKGQYVVVIQGLSEDGSPVSAYYDFQVDY